MEQGQPTGESFPAKRARTDDGGPERITRSSDIWFADGNLVIQAESTQFRVHCSVLSMHSSVLKDCLSIPQPIEQETVEGCPLLHLPDHAVDLDFVLPILYGDNLHVFDSRTVITVEQTAAMMRLGRKYELKAVYEEAMRRLRGDFPSDFHAWKSACLKQDRNFLPGKRTVIDIINLAVEQNLLSLLPAAMLTLCRSLPLEDILLGVELVDNARAPLLPRAMHMCIKGRTKLLCSFFKYFSECIRLVIPSNNGCSSKARCAHLVSALFVRLIGWTADQDRIKFPETWKDILAYCEDEQF
ncbi:hypothetical protein M413DRAFT_443281 [Hebeloma cylindrosporum]|uniref:BTB domain-containing protein n=1 Tax=Hebeloma cylindrosporum TaxID=76867 RepID=A0A0C3CKE7_HEBCY|nr:hypothetical protein M413DRAFT_443281 [Hebeloma cylindrosporum h7]